MKAKIEKSSFKISKKCCHCTLFFLTRHLTYIFRFRYKQKSSSVQVFYDRKTLHNCRRESVISSKLKDFRIKLSGIIY